MQLVFRFLVVVGFVVLGAWLAASRVQAQHPVASDPATAEYITGAPQSIPANSTRWYKFDYVGDRSDITVLMPDAARTLIEFNVFTPEQMKSWWDAKPIGRGTAYQIDCETGEENYMGECQSTDLKWVGQFNAPGTYYVQVLNYNTGTANYVLTVQGTGVRVGLAPPQLIPGLTPVPPPPPPPLLPATGGVWASAGPSYGYGMRFGR